MPYHVIALFSLALVGLQSTSTQGTHEYRELTLESGKTLRYALVLPDYFDSTQTYPALLALPPGPQTEMMVEAGLERYWGEQAAARGWIVASPIAPDGQLFFRGAEASIPALLDHLASEFQLEGGRFHLAGSSNGGLSAFRIALEQPSRFHSLTVLPGGPPTEDDVGKLGSLAGMEVTMFAGELDTRWIELLADTEARLKSLGVPVSTTVFPGEGHVPVSLDGGRIMRLLGGLRPAS